MNKSMSSILFSGNAWYIEELYEAYLDDAKSVNEDWQLYFNALILSDPNSRRDTPHSAIQKAYYQAARQKAHRPVINISTDATAHQKQVAVLQLINAYRFRGHR
ncbi:MAG: 2-oxoglutarate dehydrogenase E1 component, partial [Gammaproteobacteria bacterium]